MRISEVAEMCGVKPKDVIDAVEQRRAALEAKGAKLNKRLTASSGLEQEIAAEIIASFDMARQAGEDEKKRESTARKAEQDAQKRAAEEKLRLQREEERRRAEERRKAADAELARRQEEQARAAAARAKLAAAMPAVTPSPAVMEVPAPPAPPPPPAPKLEAPPAPVPEAPKPVEAPLPPRLRTTAPSGDAVAKPPSPPPVSVAPPAPPVPAPPPTAPPATPPAAREAFRADAPRPQGSRESTHYAPRVGPSPAVGGGPTSRRDGPPSQRDSRGPGMSDRGLRPEGGRYSDRGPRPEGTLGSRTQGDRPPRADGTAGPRPYGDRGPRPEGQSRSYGDRGPRPEGQSRSYGDRSPRPEGQGQRPYGDRGPRTGGPGGDSRGPRTAGPGAQNRGPGGDSRGPRMAGPGGSGRGPGGPAGPRTGPGSGRSSAGPGSLTRGLRVDTSRPEEPLFGTDRSTRRRDGGKKDKEKDRDTSIRDFIETGLGTGLKEQFTARRTAGAAAAKPVGKAAPKRKGDETRRIKPSQLFHEMGDDPMRERRRGRRPGQTEQRTSTDQRERVIEVYGALTVGEFAKRLGVQAAEVIKRLFLLGEVITINQPIEPAMMELIAGELGAKVLVHQESDEHDIAEFSEAEDNPEDIVARAPVVTVMGHVDHGKTTLLDYIRKSNVAAGEAGGMTQHIGAYEVQTAKGRIVFLDTPGHAAFTEMRARGARVTDIVVLVVAADDGVMPQTIEAIDHAKAADVPIIVAINKMDAPGANPARVKQELMRHGLVPEELGGDVIMQPVSALKGTNMDELLEMIALQSDVLELKANPNRAAEGTVVESRIDPLRGATVTVLVERGTLRIGDVFLCGVETGRVRAMRNSLGASVEEAGPSTPVEILGITGSPAAGEHFMVLPDEATARDIADDRLRRRRAKEVIAKPHITLENLAQHIAESETKTLNLIIKADVQGSVEALRGALAKIKSTKVQLNIIRAAVGGITASDVSLADASDAVIIGFNVRPDTEATTSAERLGVSIRTYDIIFNLVEDVEKAMIGLLDPVLEEKEEGRAYVQAIFKISKVGTIAGCKVENGTIERNHSARLVRDGVVIWTGKLASLKRHKDDAKSVATGFECGIGLAGYNDVKVGDYIETFSTVKKEASLLTEV